VDISLVVCTRNRAAQLVEALESFARIQCHLPWELVIVDNGSTDDTPAVLSDFKARFNGSLTLVTAKRPGLGHARNVGWRAARGDIVAFTDDDCYPEPDYLTQVAHCLADPRFGFVGGRVLLHDPLDYPITIQLSTTRREFRPRAFIPPGSIHGANFSFRRAALEKIGGFDERLGAGTNLYCAEDADALARVCAFGWWGVYDPGPTVRHHHRRRDLAEIARIREGHSVGTGALFFKCVVNWRISAPYLIRWPRIIWRAGIGQTGLHIVGVWRYLMAVAKAPKQPTP
jgi:glycosyltransferase involved in cell wall biosynthesis